MLSCFSAYLKSHQDQKCLIKQHGYDISLCVFTKFLLFYSAWRGWYRPVTISLRFFLSLTQQNIWAICLWFKIYLHLRALNQGLQVDVFFIAKYILLFRLDVSPLNGYDGQWRKEKATSFHWYPFVILFKKWIRLNLYRKNN
jgi:hypothetical protein